MNILKRDTPYKAVVVIPTYNERNNILKLIPLILRQATFIDAVELSVLIVDDNSPDGTSDAIREIMKSDSSVHLLTGNKKGYGNACIRGFMYAMEHLQADLILQMDADFSHDPAEIPYLIHRLLVDSDVVIGSRYVDGGSLPEEWPIMRHLNSKLGNLVARYVAGMSSVKDCTSGFRAIKADVLRRIEMDKLGVKGYAFQISFLHALLQLGVHITEIPIQFKDRTVGNSKLRLTDRIEFVMHALWLRLQSAKPVLFILMVAGLMLGFFVFLDRTYSFSLNYYAFVAASVALISIFLTIQSLFTVFWMLYAWERPEYVNLNKSPTKYLPPQRGFTALVPARNEEFVIADTIKAISRIDYPEHLKETFIICQNNDTATIRAVNKAISDLKKDNIKLITFSGEPVNKPRALNMGLRYANKDTVVIFDAEDEPHKDIYKIANTVFIRDRADVLQSGVQLMNFQSRWFSMLNVLEYYFWFKSALHYFSRIGLVPLGGNTVFFKSNWLHYVQGWDETCLTEDADIGIRLSLAGANMRIIYDEAHTTREETPSTLHDFIRQRARWNQGFLQILFRGQWLKFPKMSQKLLAFYILFWSQTQVFIFLYMPISFLLFMSLKIPVWITIITMLPLYCMLLQLLTQVIGLYEFTRDYKLRYPLTSSLQIMLTYFPYQLVMGYSALRATSRFIFNNNNWDKTLHTNEHRKIMPAKLYESEYL
ncbi:MAG: hypothetical protein RI947_1268 [Candidatus Parcubacteria bacterium]|jgi:cellulose synthase/poly-beta-1,6-N-acetylglucosamine synthase-like glycosyltransferase